ncbi:MAG: response regulator transcription factor [Phycisphaerales bacterium]|nr:response regulator transcription factor [Phycisphaerales bacterium]
MRVLIVEDSIRLRTSLTDGLAAAGYAVDAIDNGRDGLAYARATSYDVIILDLMLPEMDGLSMLRAFREARGITPVIVLSARDRVEHRIEGLRAGADDYLVKPFAFDELLARLEALSRRSHGITENNVCIDGVELDLGAKCFRYNGDVLELTPREFAILEYLFVNAGRTVSRPDIEEHVYAADRQVWSNAVDSAIAAIRRKLSTYGIDCLIHTRRGLGYIVDQPRDAAGTPS